jgi:ribose transport system ATP-binding protein
VTAGVAPRLDLAALDKTFGQVHVLHDVALSVAPGEVHGLAGQNGSGKSTLIKILTGIHAPDPGARLAVDGRPVGLPVRWPEAHAAGISVVHQDLGLLDSLTVAENVCVGGFPTTRLGRIDRRERDRMAARTLGRLGVDIDPSLPVGALGAAERAEVAIARALRDHAGGRGLMILDESTRALSGDDLERVHALIRRIAEEGSSVVLISHSLKELVSVTDRVTVLRDGRVVLAGAPGLSEPEIARAMLGGQLAALGAAEPRKPSQESPVQITGLSGGRVEGIDVEIGRGEVVGITGRPGSGYEDIPALLSGAMPAQSGSVHLGNSTLALRGASVLRCLRAGIAVVPERRDRDGLALGLSVQDNVCLPRFRTQRRWYLSRRWQRGEAKAAVGDLGIRPADPHVLISQLSGGNQQKVLMAKWLAMRPTLMVLHEPTQAVDVGARHEILVRVVHAARRGSSVLLVSSEPDDLAAVCDRVLVYQPDGRLHEVAETTPEALIDEIFPIQSGTTRTR